MDEKEFDYLNVIPLVDVMLVLLTIVLTTSTFIARGAIPVDLPRAAHSHEEGLKTLTIEIDSHGTIFFKAEPVTLPLLRERLQPAPRSTPVLIRSDRGIPLQDFIDVLDLIKGSGFAKVSVQTDQRQGGSGI
ncbi:biopolymer transporter ExbD [Geobacter sp. AOG2]|uniref:ExbD/TolR family protein n=1 Tax=Geobacter sp. AOG2 TaxID=1566347 RepID=UPI001CC46C9F|nr:biopolymer transporter ExbD [Geobacter sp. AOG2]GFE60675.1 biopolymer transport protein ExbD [Geobacter sp. AOG2]